MRNEKGITLIALVITIIVLLILAGVSIAMLSGNNGLLTKASTAKQKNNEAEIADRINMAINAEYASILAGDQVDTEANIKKNNDLGTEYTVKRNDILESSTGTVEALKITHKDGIEGSITYDATNKTYTITKATVK